MRWQGRAFFCVCALGGVVLAAFSVMEEGGGFVLLVRWDRWEIGKFGGGVYRRIMNINE